MIEMDEEMNSTVSDSVLCAVLSFADLIGYDAKDKLLYNGRSSYPVGRGEASTNYMISSFQYEKDRLLVVL